MGTEAIEKFDPSTYVDKLRDVLKTQLVNLIPEEQWTLLVKAEIASFFTDSSKRDHYSGNNVVVPSEFKKVLGEVMREEAKSRIRAMLTSTEWTGYWDGTKQVAGEAIVDMLKKNGAEIINDWLRQAITQVVQSLRFTQT